MKENLKEKLRNTFEVIIFLTTLHILVYIFTFGLFFLIFWLIGAILSNYLIFWLLLWSIPMSFLFFIGFIIGILFLIENEARKISKEEELRRKNITKIVK